MDTEAKLKEIENTISELEKLERYMYEPIRRFRHLREQVASSVDFLRGLHKDIKKATRKNRDLMVDLASGMETTDAKILDRFFAAFIENLQKTIKEVDDKWAAIRELRAAEQKVGEPACPDTR